MVTLDTLAGDSAAPSGRRCPRSPRLRSPNTKQRHQRASQAARSGSKSGEGGHRTISEAGSRGGEAMNRLNEILSGFVVTAGMTTKPGSCSSFASRSGQEKCAHKKATRSAPPSPPSALNDSEGSDVFARARGYCDGPSGDGRVEGERATMPKKLHEYSAILLEDELDLWSCPVVEVAVPEFAGIAGGGSECPDQSGAKVAPYCCRGPLELWEKKAP